MARWLWCFGTSNVVRQSPSQDGQTARKQQSSKKQPRAVQLQAASSKAQKHVLFEAGGGHGAGDSDAAATDASAALSQQLMAALKANRDLRINTEPQGSLHSNTAGYSWSSIGFGAPGRPVSPKVSDEDPIQRAVLQDQSDAISQLPVVSHSSLDMAFSKSMQAIAVVRVASHIHFEPRSSDGGTLSSTAGAEDDFPIRRGFTSSMRVSMVCSDDGGGSTAGEPSQPTSQQQQQQQQQPGTASAAKLEPVYLNKTVQTMLDCRDHEEYTFTMDKQLMRNPMLAMLFENCVQRLLAGKVTSVRQYTPVFSSPNSVHPTAQARFVNLQINTCLFQDISGSQRPSLFLWYNAPSSQFDLTSQLKRNYMALASVPSMVAVIAMDGRVLQQNSSSVAYMGFAMGSKIEGTHLGDPCHTLQRLFVLHPEALDEMLTTLQEGKSWQGQMKVPPQLDLAEPCEDCQKDDDLDWEASEDNTQNDNQNNNVKDDNDVANNTISRLSRSASDGLKDAQSSPAAAAAGLAAHLPGAVESFRNSSRASADASSPGAAAASSSARSAAAAAEANSVSLHRTGSTDRTGSSVGAAAKGAVQFPKSASAGGGAAASLKPLLSGAQVSLSGSSISLPAGLRAGSCSLSSKMVKSRAMQMFFGVDHKKSWRHSYRMSAGSAATSRRPSTAGGSTVGATSPRGTLSGSSERWHRVQANKFSDPTTGEDVILLISTDITQRVAAEKQLQQVLNAEHKLLEGIFPKQVLQALTKSAIRNHIQTCGGGSSATGEASFSSTYQAINASKIKLALKHEQVSIMFADIVGFTSMSKEVEPSVVMEFLNDLYTRFDDLLEDASVYKVETIGDCYMVAGGLIFTDAHGFKTVLQSEVDPLHAHRTFAFAVAMLKAAQGLTLPGSGQPVKMRVGIHSGPCVSGVVGSRMPRFCLFGDSVNTASRMESSNKMPGTIHVSDVTKDLIGGDFWQDAGQEEIKGKGLMGTFYYNPEATTDGSGLAAVLQKASAVACTPDK